MNVFEKRSFWKTKFSLINVFRHLWMLFYMQFYRMLSYMQVKSCGGAKTSWYFLWNYSMISTDALQVGFVSSPLFVNDRSRSVVVIEVSSLTIVYEGVSLTIVNETTNLIKTVVFEKNCWLWCRLTYNFIKCRLICR